MAKSIKPYATVYPFFSDKLGLHGSDLLTFAVIFSFWKKRETPVLLSYSMVQKITGLSRSSVGKSIRCLFEKGIITKEETRQGHTSLLSVVLPEEVCPGEWNAPPVRKRDGYPSGDELSSRPESGHHNKNRNKRNNNNNSDGFNISRALAIPDVKRFDDGDTW